MWRDGIAWLAGVNGLRGIAFVRALRQSVLPPMDLTNATRRLSLRFGLVAVLSTAAALRLWRLDQNGFGNEYYSAGVRSMSLGWHNFFFNSFDPAGFISIDKPPVALPTGCATGVGWSTRRFGARAR
jgi:hypothetical protein